MIKSMPTVLFEVLSFFVRWLISARASPIEITDELGLDPNRPILYLTETHSFSDKVALQKACHRLGLPDPCSKLTIGDQAYNRTWSLYYPQTLFGRRVKGTGLAKWFARLMQKHQEFESLDVQIVPVFITWGRSPGSSESRASDLLADRSSPSWLRKLFIVLMLGRDNFVSFSKPIRSQQLNALAGDTSLRATKLIRVVSTHFHRKRKVMTGPNLLHPVELQSAVIGSQTVQAALESETADGQMSRKEAKSRAVSYLNEIAADYREGLIRLGDRLLTRLWNKTYNGIKVNNAARVRELADNGHEIIYVPCHRSHMDYLLLTYVIYHEGLVTPHIAAGINLNFWPVGGIFRSGGAFFLRRSFGGNRLYTAVFRAYLHLLFDRGYSVKYYAEGGRSRTGRLLAPKTGMLAMTLQAMIEGVQRPVSIVPVYIGYEHVMEVKGYLRELSGGNKEKESPLQVMKAATRLKNYGYGFVNFGQPILLSQFLDDSEPEWFLANQDQNNSKPSWLTPTANKLADTLIARINQNAAVNPTSLMFTLLLASQNHKLSRPQAEYGIQALIELMQRAPYAEDVSLPSETPAQVIDHVLTLKNCRLTKTEYEEVITYTTEDPRLTLYYRNNVGHLLVLPSLILARVSASQGCTRLQLVDFLKALFPLIKAEYFLSFDSSSGLDRYINNNIDHFIEQGYVLVKDESLQVTTAPNIKSLMASLIARFAQDDVQRLLVIVHLICRYHTSDEELTRALLKNKAHAACKYISERFGLNSPEFYEKSLINTLIQRLFLEPSLVTVSEQVPSPTEQLERLEQQLFTMADTEATETITSMTW